VPNTAQQGESFFDANAKFVTAVASNVKADKDLVAAFMTISDYIDQLYDEDINLWEDITVGYLNDFMRKDFNKIINHLRKYKGDNRKGVQEARDYMDAALKFLYTAMTAIKENNSDEHINALVSCRRKLEEAHGQLEHWEDEIPR